MRATSFLHAWPSAAGAHASSLLTKEACAPNLSRQRAIYLTHHGMLGVMGSLCVGEVAVHEGHGVAIVLDLVGHAGDGVGWEVLLPVDGEQR